jgi:hypothetical protein
MIEREKWVNVGPNMTSFAACLVLSVGMIPPIWARAAAIEPAGAREFANQVIAYEERPDSTLRDKAFLAFFTPRFRMAIVKDMAGPELNVIDSDFLSQSQTGVEKMRVLEIEGSKNLAVVTVKCWSEGVSPPVTLKWHLRRDRQWWRISDVETASGSSLLIDLERSNRLH